MEKNKKELLEILLTDNKSGYKLREGYLKTNYNNHFNEVKKLKFDYKTSLYLYLHDMDDVEKCKVCNKDLSLSKSFGAGFPTFCSIKCANKDKDRIEQIKQTNIKKYGGKSPISSDEIKNKIKNTNIKKYGVNNYFELKDKIKEKVFEKYGVDHFNKTNTFKKIRNKKYEDKYPNIKIINDEITYDCEKCNNMSILNQNIFNYRNRNDISLCLNCYPEYKSSLEFDLESYFNSNGIIYNKHDRKLIKPKEIDFIIDNIGIEIGGLYYHSNKFVEKEYHYDKWLKSINNNIKLIQIFEDEWRNKQDIVISILNNVFKKNINKIFARKCEIREIGNNEYKTFLNNNHLQGYVYAKIKIGLFYNNELVQIMSFDNNRISLGSKPIENEYEMIRLCTKQNINIIGGSKKLLNYFEKEYKPKKITSYCDNRFFTGETYLNLGFKLEKITKPNYYYFKPNNLIRLNRFNFREDVLGKQGIDKNKTEKEIMLENNYFIIYDAGNKKFIKIYPLLN